MDITFVYRGSGHSISTEKRPAHPAHHGFQDYVDADQLLLSSGNEQLGSVFLGDILQSSGTEYPNSDVFLLFSTALYSAPFIRRQCPDSKIIYVATHEIFGINSYNFRKDSLPKRIARTGERWINHKIMLRLADTVDGILAVSDYTADYVRAHTETPVESIYPYVQPRIYGNLFSLPINNERDIAIIVCEHRDHKGVDLAVRAWPKVVERNPDAQLRLIGKGHPVRYEQQNGVSVLGYVDDLEDEMKRASVLIHPARHDAFGVSIVESMAAGLVPVVTNTTGAHPIVRELNYHSVVNRTPKSIARGVNQVFESNPSQRQKWGVRARELSTEYKRDEQLPAFESKLSKLLEIIRREQSES